MKPKSNRAQYATHPFRLISQAVRDRAIAAIQNCPLDDIRPLEVVIREVSEKRRDVQNSLYWALLNEIASQAWIEGRQYDADILHVYMKRNLLPEDGTEEALEQRDGYVKWQFDPAGERVLVGSTTMLTVKGFTNLITAVEAFGSSLGVLFSGKDV